MTQLNENLNTIIAALKTERDILAVKVHLAKAEIKDQWSDLEIKWERLNNRSEKVKEELQETSDEVAVDLQVLGQDIKDGYAQIKKLLK